MHEKSIHVLILQQCEYKQQSIWTLLNRPAYERHESIKTYGILPLPQESEFSPQVKFVDTGNRIGIELITAGIHNL